MNLSESAFVLKTNKADFKARYWTCVEEIPLAGHPTIATIYTLIKAGLIQLKESPMAISLELNEGPINVDIHHDGAQVEKIVMTQRKPKFTTIHDPAVVCPLFNLEVEDLVQGVPIQTVSTGTPQLMVPVRSLEALRRARVNVEAYARYHESSDFFSPHLFVCQGVTSAGSTFARHFGVAPDMMEDPVTGSATGGMSAYIVKYGLLKETSWIAQQGHWMDRAGMVHVNVTKGADGEPETVTIGGQAVLSLKGTLFL
jgi:trans-2,3-dihydro-3-hydroxyanthranilate isomerase